MRVLIALDKFKGSLTAVQAGEAVARGWRRLFPVAEVDVCPIADGGEGTGEAVVTALGGEMVVAVVHDALGRETRARYGLVSQEGRREAVMEMSAASGLVQVSDLPQDPLRASTRGTGEMMLEAMRQGADRIVIGLGGSATNDGGMGMAAALGFEFLDAEGRAVAELPAGFETVCAIRAPKRTFPEMLVACDVRNPLLGAQGATRVYGAQKGVRDVEYHERRLEKLAELVRRDLGADHREVPGAGAAGGLGFGLMSFCGARLVPGFDLVATIIGLEARMRAADVVITGEGKLDAQSLHGKGPMGVAQMARAMGRRVIGLAGVIERGVGLEGALDLLLAVKPEGMAVEEAMRRAAELVEERVVASADAIRGMLSNPHHS